MAGNDGDTSSPIQIELVPDSSADAAASRIPGAIAAAATMPGAVALIFAADDGGSSVYNDPAILRSADSGQTCTGMSTPTSEVCLSGSFDTGGAAGDGE